jgi:hypothetical protein
MMRERSLNDSARSLRRGRPVDTTAGVGALNAAAGAAVERGCPSRAGGAGVGCTYLRPGVNASPCATDVLMPLLLMR